MTSMCNWAFLGAATIANKNWQAVHQSGNGVLRSVASRSLNRAQAFIDACQQQIPFEEKPVAIEGYESVLADEMVDAVYIPLPTAVRGKWAKAALQAGKHVLIEKPCAINADELRELISIADSRNLQIMDGVMFVHSQRFANLLELIHKRREIGEVRRIICQFSFFADDDWTRNNIRANANYEPFGALGDLGWYCIRLALEMNRHVLPERVIGRAIRTCQHPEASDSVPLEFDATLLFEGGLTASFYCSFVTENQQWANISGTDGFISLEDFVLPFHDSKTRLEVVKSQFITEGCNFEMHRNGRWHEFDEPSESKSGSQEALLFQNFGKCVIDREVNAAWAEHSLHTQIVMDALLESSRSGQAIDF